MKIVIRRTYGIGDVISSLSVAHLLSSAGWEVAFQAHENAKPVLRLSPDVTEIQDIGWADINLDGAYENNPDRQKMHFQSMLYESAKSQLAKYGVQMPPFRLTRPVLHLPTWRLAHPKQFFENHAKPWIAICPRSQSFPGRTVPKSIWEQMPMPQEGKYFWLGTDSAPEGFVDLQCRTIDAVIDCLACADVLLTTETGPMHIAAALGKRMVVLKQATDPNLTLTPLDNYNVIEPEGSLPCLNCQLGECQVNITYPPCQLFSPTLLATTAYLKATE